MVLTFSILSISFDYTILGFTLLTLCPDNDLISNISFTSSSIEDNGFDTDENHYRHISLIHTLAFGLLFLESLSLIHRINGFLH